MSSSHGASRMLAALSIMLGLGSADCTLAIRSDATQCSTDADCTGRGPAFEGTYCKQDTKICVSNLAYCRHNTECVARNGGQPFLCHQDTHTCAPLLSSHCTSVWAEPTDIERDDTIWLGSLLTPSQNAGHAGAELSLEMARQDFRSVKFLPGVGGNAEGRRNVAIISCDVPPPRRDEDMIAAVNHLADNVRVAGIVGPIPSSEVGKVVNVAIAKKVPVFSPGSTAETLRDIVGRENVLFRMTSPDSITQGRSAPIVDQYLEPLLRQGATPTVPAGEPLRLAILRDATALGISATTLFREKIVLNGKPARENIAAGSYREFSVGDPSAENFSATQAQAVAELIAFAPQLILAPTPISSTIVLVEDSWPTTRKKPYWYASAGNIGTTLNVAAREKHLDLRQRMLLSSTGPESSDPDYQTWLIGYNTLWSSRKEAVPSVQLAATTYDAMYMYFYALASIGDEPITGPRVGRALMEITDPMGVVAKAEQSALLPSLGALSQGKKLRFRGVTGAPTFDAVGDNLNTSVIFVCIPKDLSSGLVFDPSGLTLSEDGTKIEGTNNCL